ncbi:MAG: isoprenyl transferase [Tannerella sp.]|jgi:undecaprenyl diphosphate synthase|nr:isoprenyl transferase [Tannerella sp.]
MSLKETIDLERLPKHIAIIMDGNGRWAKKNGMDRYMGHKEGVVSVRKISEAVGKLGIDYLTLYTFSTENWNRPKEEIEALMTLMISAIQNESEDLMTNNVRLKIIGDLNLLPPATRESLIQTVERTCSNTGLNLTLALSYSSRWEITEAVKKISAEVKSNLLKIEQIDEETVSEYLCTHGTPDPDLLIRTGGEQRISNYLLWQLAYAELYFTDTYWPDFREESLYAAIVDYQQRERRFGKTGEQIQVQN